MVSEMSRGELPRVPHGLVLRPVQDVGLRQVQMACLEQHSSPQDPESPPPQGYVFFGPLVHQLCDGHLDLDGQLFFQLQVLCPPRGLDGLADRRKDPAGIVTLYPAVPFDDLIDRLNRRDFLLSETQKIIPVFVWIFIHLFPPSFCRNKPLEKHEAIGLTF
jgi:hypothetical protein